MCIKLNSVRGCLPDHCYFTWFFFFKNSVTTIAHKYVECGACHERKRFVNDVLGLFTISSGYTYMSSELSHIHLQVSCWREQSSGILSYGFSDISWDVGLFYIIQFPVELATLIRVGSFLTGDVTSMSMDILCKQKAMTYTNASRTFSIQSGQIHEKRLCML